MPLGPAEVSQPTHPVPAQAQPPATQVRRWNGRQGGVLERSRKELAKRGNKELLEALVSAGLRDRKKAVALKRQARQILTGLLPELKAEASWLMKHATREDSARVTLINKLIDKLVEDQSPSTPLIPEEGRKAAVSGPVLIVQNVMRGVSPQAAVEVEATDVTPEAEPLDD